MTGARKGNVWYVGPGPYDDDEIGCNVFYSEPAALQYEAWRKMRSKPRPWHYLIRAYRRVVLARKDWRLPWR